jgi:hypothetical protein
MNKKIAFLLILFMVGSWCVFAEDDINLTPLWIVLGVVVVIAIAVAATGGDGGKVLQDFGNALQNVSLEDEQENTNPIAVAMNNQIIKHTTVDFTQDKKVFVGAKFSVGKK